MSRSRTKGAVNPGCAANCGECNECVSALPWGASCASSCARVVECKALYGITGSEGACRFVPSEFTKNAPLVCVNLERAAV